MYKSGWKGGYITFVPTDTGVCCTDYTIVLLIQELVLHCLVYLSSFCYALPLCIMSVFTSLLLIDIFFVILFYFFVVFTALPVFAEP